MHSLTWVQYEAKSKTQAIRLAHADCVADSQEILRFINQFSLILPLNVLTRRRAMISLPAPRRLLNL